CPGCFEKSASETSRCCVIWSCSDPHGMLRVRSLSSNHSQTGRNQILPLSDHERAEAGRFREKHSSLPPSGLCGWNKGSVLLPPAIEDRRSLPQGMVEMRMKVGPPPKFCTASWYG